VRVIQAAAICALALAAPGVALAENALERLENRGILTVCADPYVYPYSSSSAHPPGFDIDIVQRIAEQNSLDLEYVWVDTGTRGGLGRALRNSISKGQCVIFTGIAIDEDQVEELEEKNLVFSRPYMGVGYVLVTNSPDLKVVRLEELKGTKIGVSMATPMDAWLFDQGYERELYLGNRRAMKGMAEGEITVAMVWMTAVTVARKEFPDQNFHIIDSYQPQPGMRWNLGFALPKGADKVKSMVDDAIAALQADGGMKEIVEKYGLPYFPPFDDQPMSKNE